MLSILLLTTVLLSLFGSGYTLYEDQVHKWDWRQRFIGIDVDNCLRSNRETKDLIFCATGETNVVSAINRRGEIAWRNVQEEQGRLIGSALHRADGLVTVSLYKTKNESKIFIRQWSQDDFGSLMAEKSHFIHGGFNCLVSIDPAVKLVNAICGEPVDQLKSFQYALGKEETEVNPIEKDWSNLEGSPNGLNLEKDCIIVGFKNIICLTSFSLHFLTLGDSRWSNQPLPEALPSGKKYSLERIFNENGVDVGFFGLKIVREDRDTERFYLYKLIVKNNVAGLQRQATFPKLRKVSILSDSDEPENLQFYAISPAKEGIEISKFGLDWKMEKTLTFSFDTKSHANNVHRFSIVKFGSQIELIVTFDDQRLVSLNSKGSINWSREDSLSSILWSQFVSLPYYSASTSKSHDHHAWLQNDFLFLDTFIKRLNTQVSSIQEYIISLYQIFFASDEKKIASIEEDSKEKTLVSDVFGFHKLLFIVTKSGKLFVLDNVRRGKIIWTHFDARLREDILTEQRETDSFEMERGRKCDKLPLLSVHLQRNDLFSPKVTLVTPKGYLISYNPLEGRVEETIDYKRSIKLSMLMHHPDENGIKGMILMDETDRVTFYPKSTRDSFVDHKNNYYLMVAKQTSEQISGYSLRHLKASSGGEDIAQRIWSFNLPSLTGSCLQVRWKELDEHVHSMGKVLADRAVLYKYLNPNLVAIVNRGEETSEEDTGRINVIQFYLIDAVTGSIYYSVAHRRASEPVHLVHSENFIIYSFYNEKQRRIEISSLELFEGKEMPPPPPVRTPPKIVEHLSFIFPTGIRAMKETRTIRGITNKHILIALTSGGILSLPKIFLDPRRASFATSKYASSAAAMEEGGVYLPPYIPELPIPSEQIINYNQSVVDINRIYVGTSSLESTSLLFITGLDIYYTRVTPSKTFDILKDDFDHYLIIIVLTALLLFSFATKYLAARKTLNAAWK